MASSAKKPKTSPPLSPEVPAFISAYKPVFLLGEIPPLPKPPAECFREDVRTLGFYGVFINEPALKKWSNNPNGAYTADDYVLVQLGRDYRRFFLCFGISSDGGWHPAQYPVTFRGVDGTPFSAKDPEFGQLAGVSPELEPLVKKDPFSAAHELRSEWLPRVKNYVFARIMSAREEARENPDLQEKPSWVATYEFVKRARDQ